MRKYIIISSLLIFSIILIGCSGPTNESMVSVSPSSFDFGTIAQSNGTVSTTFIVENISNEPLIINRLSTSCGCTTAEMDASDMEAGEKRTMSVSFDPTVHEDQTGLIERVVYLQTSDPIMPELEIDITATVIK